MSRYHIKENGEPGRCLAKPGNCPLGNELEHYTTSNDARRAFEKVMSNIPWTGHSKNTDWNKRSWTSRKIELNQLAKTICSENSLKNIKIYWEEVLESEEQIKNNTWVYGLANIKAGYLKFSEKVSGMNEIEAKENIIHEIAHLLTETEHKTNGGHTEIWRNKCKEISRNIPEMKNRYFKDGTALSPESKKNIRKLLKIKVYPRWVGTCPNSHKNFLKNKPTFKEKCINCKVYLKMDSTFSWEKL